MKDNLLTTDAKINAKEGMRLHCLQRIGENTDASPKEHAPEGQYFVEGDFHSRNRPVGAKQTEDNRQQANDYRRKGIGSEPLAKIKPLHLQN